jgi:hypothetical protein
MTRHGGHGDNDVSGLWGGQLQIYLLDAANVNEAGDEGAAGDMSYPFQQMLWANGVWQGGS